MDILAEILTIESKNYIYEMKRISRVALEYAVLEMSTFTTNETFQYIFYTVILRYALLNKWDYLHLI